MAKVKYYYDSETLSYRKIQPKKGKRIGVIFMAILGTFAAGFILFSIYISLPQIQTPREKSLSRELKNMQLQYDILNKKMSLAEKALTGVQERDNKLYRIYFETNPISEEQRQAGLGGINRYEDLQGYENSLLIKQTNKRMDFLMKQISVQSKSLDKIVQLAKKKDKLLDAMPAIQPVENEDLTRMASGYGMRMHPILKIKRMHTGMDFSAPKRTPVFATGDATVEKASRGGGYGNLIILDHGFGYKTYYAHLSKYNVHRGEHVERGEIIGFVGSTGLSTGYHLHYEVHKDGQVVNPVNYYYGDLTAQEYDVMLEKAQMENQSLD